MREYQENDYSYYDRNGELQEKKYYECIGWLTEEEAEEMESK